MLNQLVKVGQHWSWLGKPEVFRRRLSKYVLLQKTLTTTKEAVETFSNKFRNKTQIILEKGLFSILQGLSCYIKMHSHRSSEISTPSLSPISLPPFHPLLIRLKSRDILSKVFRLLWCIIQMPEQAGVQHYKVRILSQAQLSQVSLLS